MLPFASANTTAKTPHSYSIHPSSTYLPIPPRVTSICSMLFISSILVLISPISCCTSSLSSMISFSKKSTCRRSFCSSRRTLIISWNSDFYLPSYSSDPCLALLRGSTDEDLSEAGVPLVRSLADVIMTRSSLFFYESFFSAKRRSAVFFFEAFELCTNRNLSAN